jgi:5-methylcytosine-specific restriction endonuclease McrA
MCANEFDHTAIGYLQGDHIWPYSLFGETSWENYQLICGACNAQKRDLLHRDLREALGSGEFRKLVARFLEDLISRGSLADHFVLRDLVGHTDF